MTTTYTYNQTNRNLTFNLASNISITQQLAENTTFTLSNGFFLREADSEALPGADNQISFAIANNLINGDLAIISSENSGHDVSFGTDYNGFTYKTQQFKIDIGNGSFRLYWGTIDASQTIDIKANGAIDASVAALVAKGDIKLLCNRTGKVRGLNCAIETTNGKISAMGYGINFEMGSRIKSTNGSITLDGTGDIVVNGNRPNGGVDLVGVIIEGNEVTIKGNGGPTSNNGTFASVISMYSTSIDGGAGLVSITGTKARYFDSSSFDIAGVYIDASSSIKGNRVDIEGSYEDVGDGKGIFVGDSTIDARGDIVTLSGTSYNGSGVFIGSSTIQNKGINIVGNKGINIVGNGGIEAALSTSRGIDIYNSTIDAGESLVDLKGTGGSGTDNNVGITIANGSTVKGKKVTITGNGGTKATGNENHGVNVNSGIITSNEGNVEVYGYSGGSGIDSNTNYGVYVTGGGKITASAMGTVTVVGNDNDKIRNDLGNSNNHGLVVSGFSSLDSAVSMITSTGGKVMVTGTGRGLGKSNSGVQVESGGVITSNGSGEVVVTGTGSTMGKGGDNYGIYVNKSLISSGGGNVAVYGYSGGTGPDSDDNYGIHVSDGKITAGMTGTVTVFGNDIVRNTTGNRHNVGIFVSGTTGMITSNGGTVTVTGTGIGTGSSNFGVQITNGKIMASGSGNVKVTGTGSTTASQFSNHGVYVSGDGGTIEGSASGSSVMVIGTGGGNAKSFGNNGVQVYDRAQILSAGTGEVVVEGTSSANGTGGRGVHVNGANSKITSVMGKIKVTGTGKGVGNNIGVFCDAGGKIISTQNGEVTVTGTGSKKVR